MKNISYPTSEGNASLLKYQTVVIVRSSRVDHGSVAKEKEAMLSADTEAGEMFEVIEEVDKF